MGDHYLPSSDLDSDERNILSEDSSQLSAKDMKEFIKASQKRYALQEERMRDLREDVDNMVSQLAESELKNGSHVSEIKTVTVALEQRDASIIELTARLAVEVNRNKALTATIDQLKAKMERQTRDLEAQIQAWVIKHESLKGEHRELMKASRMGSDETKKNLGVSFEEASYIEGLTDVKSTGKAPALRSKIEKNTYERAQEDKWDYTPDEDAQ
jgi:uncharacterized protein YhaN